MIRKSSVLITGCSSGLGRQTALFLRDKGWNVYATARREEDVQLLRKEGFYSVSLDLDSSDSIKKATAEVLRHCGNDITAVVHNAGYCQVGAVEDLSREAIRSQFEANVFGPIELTSLFLPVFRKKGSGRIIFISSVNGRFSFPFMGAYCASKYAIESFSDALRREMADTKIYVTVVEPGLFKTNSLDNAKRSFLKNINQETAIHAETYKRIFENFQKSICQIPESKSLLVARTVYKILISNLPPTRIMVPKSSLIYEFAHRFFPDRLQDFLYSIKLKYSDKINPAPI